MLHDGEDLGNVALGPKGVPDQADSKVPCEPDDWDKEGVSARALRGYERELIQSVWEFAEVVAGNDPELWRKDEFGEWIYRFDYGRRNSEFGWEIFDPGIGRHAQGVYAMRPMQWQNFIRQYEAFA